LTYRNVSPYCSYGIKLSPYGQYKKTQLFESFNAGLITLNAIDPKTKLFMYLKWTSNLQMGLARNHS